MIVIQYSTISLLDLLSDEASIGILVKASRSLCFVFFLILNNDFTIDKCRITLQ